MKLNLLLNLWYKTVLLLTAVAFSNVLRAQMSATDTSNNINNAISAYHQYLYPETNLYNGSEYVDYAYTINEGIPFFETSQLATGSVVYDSVLYQNVLLLFDEVKELVVIQNAAANGKMQLNNERVTAFSLLNHYFVKLLQDSLEGSPIRSGFYDMLYNGRISVYEKQTKKVLETVTELEGVRRRIDEQDAFFVKKDNAFYTVNNKRDVLNILQDKRKEVQQFIKKKKLNVRKAKEISLVKIAAFYDQLTTK